VKKMEISQHSRYQCTFCGKNTVKREAVGIWSCKACKKTVAGGAYTLSYVKPISVFFGIKPLETKDLHITFTELLLRPPYVPPSDAFVRLLRYRDSQSGSAEDCGVMTKISSYASRRQR